jgi:hypothetical protein
MLAWPALLPQCPLFESFEDREPDGREFFEPARGVSLSRGDPTGAIRSVPWHLALERAEVQIFRRFWREDTKGGNLAFTVANPWFHNAPLLDEDFATLLDLNDTPLLDTAVMTVRFGQAQPQTAQMGTRTWRVAFDLDILDG